MPVHPTRIAGLFRVHLPVHEDASGWYHETYKADDLRQALGRTVRFVHGYHLRSPKGTLRGFHVAPWDTFVSIVRGHAMYVVADPRPDSPTFGKHAVFELGDPPAGRERIFVEQGLATAFLGLTDIDVVVDLSKPFDARQYRRLRWDDPTLAVPWPTRTPKVAPQDEAAPTLTEFLAVGGSEKR